MFCKILISGLLSFLSITGLLHTAQADSKKKEEWSAMATQVDSWTDGLGMGIDPEIKETVIVLNLLGLKTHQSCYGHTDYQNPSPWISFSIEDPEMELISLKRTDVYKNIQIHERELMKKYPDTALSKIYQKDHELILLYKESQELWNQFERLSRMHISKLYDLLKKFYKTHFSDYDRVLNLTGFDSSSYQLISIGSNCQVIRDHVTKLKKLKEYQEEMKLFTKFLTDCYWSEAKVANV